MSNYTIRKATSKEDFHQAIILFNEYADSLGFDLSFQNFDKELEEIDSHYNDLDGGIFLVFEDKAAIACAALRRLDISTGEVKRMYIQKPHRGKNLSDQMMIEIISLAKILHYQKLRLDTLDYMTPAIELYKKHGFKTIEAYRHNPFDNAVYMELNL